MRVLTDPREWFGASSLVGGSLPPSRISKLSSRDLDVVWVNPSLSGTGGLALVVGNVLLVTSAKAGRVGERLMAVGMAVPTGVGSAALVEEKGAVHGFAARLTPDGWSVY